VKSIYIYIQLCFSFYVYVYIHLDVYLYVYIEYILVHISVVIVEDELSLVFLLNVIFKVSTPLMEISVLNNQGFSNTQLSALFNKMSCNFLPTCCAGMKEIR